MYYMYYIYIYIYIVISPARTPTVLPPVPQPKHRGSRLST